MTAPRTTFALAAALLSTSLSLMAHDPHDPFTAVAVSPNYAQDHTILAATDFLTLKLGVYLLLKSTNGGATWSVVQGLPNNNQMIAIAFSPGYAQDQTIYVAGAGGLSKSTNQGASWTLIGKSPLLALALSPEFAADNTMFAITTGNVISKSTNRGQSWTGMRSPSGLTAGLSAITASPNYDADNTLLLGGVADGIFISTNGGAAWTHATSGQTLPMITSFTFSPAFSTDRTAFATTYGSGLLTTLNAGASWIAASSGISDPYLLSLALSPTYLQDSTLWVSAAQGGVFQSTNLGQTFGAPTTANRALSSQSCNHYQTVVAASTGSGTVLFLGMYEGLWTSTSGSPAWQYIDILPTRLVRYINLSPNFAEDQTLFANSYGGGNLWSTNGGTSWTVQNTGMQLPYTDGSGISPNFANDGTAFSSNLNGLERTTNRGASWTLLPGIGSPAYPRGFAVSPNYANDSTVMIGLLPPPPTCTQPAMSHHGNSAASQGIYLSPDGGSTWNPTSLTGVTGIISIAFSPNYVNDKTAFAASGTTGLYKSTDGGMTWSLLNTPLTTAPMAKVTVTPTFAADQTVFAGGLTGGILKSTNGGATWSTLTGTASLRVLDLEVSPNYANDQSFFVGTFQRGLMKFTKGGMSIFQMSTYPDTLVTAIGVSPNFKQDHTLFAASYYGIFKSTNGGGAWTNLAAPARIEESRNPGNSLQQPPTISYQGAWRDYTNSTIASTSAYMLTSEPGDTATLTFSGTGVRWISWVGPEQGSASVQIDGVTQGTVTLTQPANAYQQNVWEQQGISCGLHTFSVTATPEAGQTVSLDAFDVWVDACMFPGVHPEMD